MRINVDLAHIDLAIKELQDYAKKIQRIKNEIAEELAYLGANVIEENYDLSGEDFQVNCIQTDSGYTIIATGENVMFLEFGAGIYTEDYEHEPINAEIRAGAWSETEGSGTFARHGHWHYRGIDYEGIAPCFGFYFAREEILKEAQRVATEVIKRYD